MGTIDISSSSHTECRCIERYILDGLVRFTNDIVTTHFDRRFGIHRHASWTGLHGHVVGTNIRYGTERAERQKFTFVLDKYLFDAHLFSYTNLCHHHLQEIQCLPKSAIRSEKFPSWWLPRAWSAVPWRRCHIVVEWWVQIPVSKKHKPWCLCFTWRWDCGVLVRPCYRRHHSRTWRIAWEISNVPKPLL